MAEKLDSFKFSRGRGAGHPLKESWDEWLDGSIWRLTRGVDFEAVQLASMQQLARRQARKRGVRARTAIDGDALVLQAVPHTEDK